MKNPRLGAAVGGRPTVCVRSGVVVMCLPSDFTGMELRVANRYRLGRKIGNGSFGDIYLGK